MPTVFTQNATVRVRPYQEGWDYAVRNTDDNDGWITVGTGMTITASYDTVNENLWAWDNRPTAHTTGTGAYTNVWAWDCSTGTSATTRYTVDAWNKTYDQVRVTRTQSDLQRAIEAARTAGGAQRDWSIAEWAEANDVDLEDFTDDQSGQVMDTYLHSWAIGANRRFDVEAAARRDEAAKVKAEHLLTSLLSAEQKREWLEHRWVTEISPSGRIWRLLPEWSGGQLLMDPENPNVRRVTLCVHPVEMMPVVDSMVGVLLALRNGDEDMLLGLANVHSGSLTAEERQIKADWRAGRRAAHGAVRGPQPEAVYYDEIAINAEAAPAVVAEAARAAIHVA